MLPLHLGQRIICRTEKPVKGWLKEQVQYINDLDYLKYNCTGWNTKVVIPEKNHTNTLAI